MNSVLLGFEVDVGSLHKISRRLPSHQRVFPTVSLGENIPIHSPAITPEISRLCSRLGLLVDSIQNIRNENLYRFQLIEIKYQTYRTVLPWSSIGAPEMVAAGRTSSVPSCTRLGTGVYVLRIVSTQFPRKGTKIAVVRGGLVEGNVVIGLVSTWHRRHDVCGLGRRAFETAGDRRQCDAWAHGVAHQASSRLCSERRHGEGSVPLN